MRVFAATLAAVFCLGGVNAAPYTIDPTHSSVGFEVKHLMVSKVKGNFKKFSGEVEFDGKKLTKLSGEVKIADINTDNNARDKHLNDADFFDAKKFPNATLTMTKFEKGKVYADLKIRDVVKNVVFNAEIGGPIKHPKTGKDVISISLRGEINRKDFKVGEDTADNSVSEKVIIEIELEASAK
ncbi:YceI family protein [uncultured Helicobacter sp.]|uniref:YceI family protein n=1 Tax=uncultured Helicobacter sp. TaxID=175537 RepID=UPI001C3A27DB|nr:YceI family protein [Candidatus Helicobacter avicola]